MTMDANKRNWTTYRTIGYTHDVADDQRSAGGVHLYQVRLTKKGWQARILQVNGRYQAASPASPLSAAAGEAAWATAAQHRATANSTR